MFAARIANQRYQGAIEYLRPLAGRSPSAIRASEAIEARRADFHNVLDEAVFTEPTPEAAESIQKKIGELQALHDLARNSIRPDQLLARYERERHAIAVHADRPPANTMWNEQDREIAPTERGYVLIDEVDNETRKLGNQLHGAAEIELPPVDPSRRGPLQRFRTNALPPGELQALVLQVRAQAAGQ